MTLSLLLPSRFCLLLTWTMANQGNFWRVMSWLPISGYPVWQNFSKRRTILLLAIGAFLLYSGLTIWNLLTQGRENTYTSILLPRYINDDKTACTPRMVSLGDTLYTSGSGFFPWSVTGIYMSTDGNLSTSDSFMYTGASFVSNITFVSFAYEFASQSYVYNVCANSSILASYMSAQSPSSSGSSIGSLFRFSSSSQAETEYVNATVTMCASFNMLRDNPCSSAENAQDGIEAKILGIAAFLPQLNFDNGTIPASLFPPYTSAAIASPITQALSYGLSFWLNGISYLPSSGVPDNGTTNSGFGALHDLLVLPPFTSGPAAADIATAFETTAVATNNPNAGAGSGIGLMINGLGLVRMQTTEANAAVGFTEPEVWTNMRNYTLESANLIMDLASSDLNSVSLSSAYLCTIASEEWGSPMSLFAMIIGNNGAVFRTILGFLITLAAWMEGKGRAMPDSAGTSTAGLSFPRMDHSRLPSGSSTSQPPGYVSAASQGQYAHQDPYGMYNTQAWRRQSHTRFQEDQAPMLL